MCRAQDRMGHLMRLLDLTVKAALASLCLSYISRKGSLKDEKWNIAVLYYKRKGEERMVCVFQPDQV